MIFKRKYFVSYFFNKNGNSTMASIQLTIKGKPNVDDFYRYLKEKHDAEELILINWIKL